MIYRTYAINSSWNLFNKIYEIKNLLEKNMYSPCFIDTQIKSFLNNKFSDNDTSKDNFKQKTHFLQVTVYQ